jgi:hypothetical protein
MPLFQFQRGDFCPVAFGLYQGVFGNFVSPLLLSVKSHNFDLDVLTFDVTGALAGGNTQRIGGKADYKGTAEAYYDLSQSPYAAPPGIVPGNIGIMLHYVSPLRPFQIPVVVKKLHFAVAVTDGVLYSFDAEMASQFGLIVFPAA